MQYMNETNFAQFYAPSYICNMDISSRLDKAMHDAGITSQTKLYDLSGVPQATISRILKMVGKKGPETDTIKKLASALNVTFEWLLEGRDNKDKAAQSNVTSIYKRAPQTRFEWLDLATTKATLALREDAIKGSKLSLLIWYFYEELVDNKGEDITPEKTERIIKLVANSR